MSTVDAKSRPNGSYDISCIYLQAENDHADSNGNNNVRLSLGVKHEMNKMKYCLFSLVWLDLSAKTHTSNKQKLCNQRCKRSELQTLQNSLPCSQVYMFDTGQTVLQWSIPFKCPVALEISLVSLSSVSLPPPAVPVCIHVSLFFVSFLVCLHPHPCPSSVTQLQCS